MKNILLRGGRRLTGTLGIHGAKNAILPILSASLLAEEPVILNNCPRLSDIDNMLEILRRLGCRAEQEEDRIYIDSSDADGYRIDEQLSRRLRASLFILGPLIGRFGKAVLSYPGGCDIGMRPVDLHLKGLRAMGARIDEQFGYISCEAVRLKGCEIYLDYPSVGATENLMMAAAAAEGETVINNPAKEPEITELARFIETLGGSVSFLGNSVQIKGAHLSGGEFSPMADRIAAGTYMIAAAITGGDVAVTGISPEYLRSLINKLSECGCEVECGADRIRVSAPWRLKSPRIIETMPYPGFPTDLQAQIMALQTVCEGTCIIVENIFENRLKHAAELIKMGADITVKGRTAVIKGVYELYGANVTAFDLRGGAAMVLAGLRARGVTRVMDAGYINRGYYRLEENLSKLGADIKTAED
ncbi:MAG: UDP-N-acetylglucosamine 1-carboxyvinyltransferase [Selenomonadales bacterium]|jgi:UDP-N-acetylglucosamine 1-carboxyvinyltransferase|nr:UDP-N-acetylglucosamine 1-carboxyvinyltransferase [Clostridiales bacterium]PWL96836.1 MAG: UDP-N-acetylglucosamine 1-carboxyvinyltransferase [Selenomonadales bacterium]